MPGQVLVKVRPLRKETVGGIKLPETMAQPIGEGVVLASGIDGILKGCEVFFDPRMGYKFTVVEDSGVGGIELLALMEDELRGYIEEAGDGWEQDRGLAQEGSGSCVSGERSG
jgi:hypothetical protein